MFPTEPVPERIGAYKIVRRAQGAGEARVYVARKDGPMGFARLYTLKLVPNTVEGDSRFAEELVREAAICSTLNHQAIQRMIDFFEHDRDLVLVLEHVEGTTLDRFMSYLEQNKKPLSDGAKAYIGREIASALGHAHGARDENGKPMPIVHRGLHPEHVLLGWDGQVRLSGFGLGKILGRSPDTVVAQRNASPGFKAPEQLRGETITPKADVYGLGLFLWWLFSGQKPSEKGIRPPRLSTIRGDLLKAVATAIDAALETSVEKRPSSCREIEMALGLVPGMENGRDELCEKLELLHASRPNPDSASRPSIPVGASRPRIPLQSIRPSQPAISSKERLSTVPPAPLQSMRPANSLPPILFDDVQPKSVYPLLKALAEKVPKQDGGIPKAPRLPQVENAPASNRGAQSERAPRSGVPKLAIAAPLELDAGARKPRTEWMASVPDEDAFEKLFDEATSRSPSELEAAGIGKNGDDKGPESAQKSRRRFEYADTMPVQTTLEDLAKSEGAESKVLATPPLGPPPKAKPVRFGPRPEAPAPPKLKRGFAPPPVPPVQEKKRPSVVLLAVIFASVAIGVALVVLAFSDKPSSTNKAIASASATPSASASVLAPATKATAMPSATAQTKAPANSAEGPAPPLPYGQGYLTVVYPDEATVFVSGRKLGQTNTRLQNKCGRYFVRIAKTGDGPYPEWLSAGQPVAIPCQDSIRVEIPR